MTTFKFKDIDVSKFSIGNIREGTKMRTFYIDYNHEIFSVQSPHLLLDWGGVPKLDQYHQKDSDRRYVLYGIEPQAASKTRETAEEYQKRSRELEAFDDWLRSIEDWVNTDSVQTKLFGTKSADFIPLVRAGTNGAPNKIKFKFYADRETGDPDFDLCQCKEGKTEWEETEGMTLEDLRSKVFRYMGKQRFIFQIRGWTDKIFKQRRHGSHKPVRFGISLVIKSVEYSAPVQREVSTDQPEFLDSDDEIIVTDDKTV